ncbi:CpsB/CapC family capsule biosynthesis tyrosine phosphatase [Flavobacterium dauae]|uniref:tyrosine-protein phosphatase n=1 Tax=Flavobacterium dauae TaxID=1563479 RepID=UPI00101B3236|nr:CpsB/CapC family capsule biosynthesis tyrosine phosphatase [Flavobacterium dauae]WLD24576.1 CpsB/CapC family capsule biosynthesis tyrosine phosphatase [Flavobacterium dauae]
MFSFFKKKKILKDTIPNGFVDIHSHILYGLDDGAKTLKESQDLIFNLKSFGFGKFTATPHTTPLVWDNTKEGILKQYEKVKNELNFTDKELRVASEYLIDDSFLKRLETEKLLTLKDNLVLVEMSYLNPPINLYEIILELNSQGYTPVLAHPERYNFYKNDAKSFKRLKKAGCLFQMNLLSSVGYYGSSVTEIADYLLKEKMYDFVGSDVHHQKHIAAFLAEIKLKNIDEFESVIEKNKFFA